MLTKLLVFIVFFSCFSFITSSHVYAAVTWSETNPADDQDRGWAASSISSDGQKMVVGNQDGGFFITTNRGSSWVPESPSGSEFDVWYISAMSSDGRVILAGIYGGYLYLSQDGGDTWSETQPAGHTTLNWTNVNMSSDGKVILVSSESGRLYKTVNGGSTWSEVRPLGNQDLTWRTAISDTGQIIFASEDDGSGGRLYISRDAGNSWSETQPIDNADHGWTSVSMSADGQVMLAAVSADRVYISRNGGGIWTTVDIVGQWNRSSMSADGKTMLVSSTQRLYVSNDTGNTWTETRPVGDQDKDWELMSVSGNARVLLTGGYSGRVYIASNPPLQIPEKSSSPQCAVKPTGPDLFQINTTNTTARLYFAPVGYATHYKVSYGVTSDADQFSIVTNLGASTGVLSYTVSELPANTPLFFKVYSQNDCLDGTWGNTMSVQTDGKVYYKSLLSRILSIVPKTTTDVTAQHATGSTSCSSYTVQSGDSLWSIASEKLGNGTFFGQIQKSNNLTSSLLHVGQILKVGC